MSVSEHIDLSGRLNGRPCSNEGRRMMSRKRGDNMRILASIPTGEHKAGACDKKALREHERTHNDGNCFVC